jgi:hypothetical protein
MGHYSLFTIGHREGCAAWARRFELEVLKLIFAEKTAPGLSVAALNRLKFSGLALRAGCRAAAIKYC